MQSRERPRRGDDRPRRRPREPAGRRERSGCRPREPWSRAYALAASGRLSPGSCTVGPRRPEARPPGREPDASQRALAVDGHVVPRQAHDAAARQLQVRIAGGIAFAVAAGAVNLEAVELDGELVGWPEGVDLVRGLLSFD